MPVVGGVLGFLFSALIFSNNVAAAHFIGEIDLPESTASVVATVISYRIDLQIF
jgi:hypothetical protein